MDRIAPLPGSSPSLAAKVQEIQAGAVSSMDRFASCPNNEPCTPAGCEAGGGSWPRCPTEAGAIKGGEDLVTEMFERHAERILEERHSENENSIRAKLIKMGWAPPGSCLATESRLRQNAEAELDKSKDLLAAAIRAKGDADRRAAMAERLFTDLLTELRVLVGAEQDKPTTNQGTKQ